MPIEPTCFLHGVASGDPLTDRVIIWTRVSTHSNQTIEVNWRVARDAAMREIVASGITIAKPGSDFTVHVDVDGLEPDTHYFYQFAVPGDTSPTGRTKTLALDPQHIKFAQVSCAKFNAGFFNAFARIAVRNDLDFILHLGDYIYEASNTPPKSQTPGANIGRPFDPLHECKTLDDYRRRYAQYHRDPDIQRMHASLPMIATLDDHEFADGAWRDGCDTYDPEKDEPWSKRKAQAFQARWEWLPQRMPNPSDPSRVYRRVAFGKLADLFLIDTRTMRDQPVPAPAMNDPVRSELGHVQREWLFNELDASTTTWRLLGNPSVLATTWAPHLSDTLKKALVKVKLIDADGVGPDYDQWDGYPVERDLLLQHLRDHKLGNVVVLSGDVHVALAIELKRNPFDANEAPIAVECVNTSLTSQNLDDKLGWMPRTESVPLAEEWMRVMPHIKWADLDSHGYNVVEVTPERVLVEFWFVDTVLHPSNAEWRGAAFKIESGKRCLIRVG